MAKFINIAAVHFEIDAERGAPEAMEKVLRQFACATERLEGCGLDLLVTSEGMGAIGQTVAMAESPLRPGPLYKAYGDFARRNRCVVAGAMKLEDKGKVYNALAFFERDGSWLGAYRKCFLTRRETESGLSHGNEAVTVDSSAGRLGGVICFYLNYDRLRDAYHKQKPDILLFSSMFHGGHLQRNWAYQCRAFLASACKDNTSDIVNPLGRVIASANFFGRISQARINLDRFIMHQDYNMNQFPGIKRKYHDAVVIEWDSALGIAILYANDTGLSAIDIAAEFELVPLDAYLRDSLPCSAEQMYKDI